MDLEERKIYKRRKILEKRRHPGFLGPREEAKRLSISSELSWSLEMERSENVIEPLYLQRCSQHNAEVIERQQKRDRVEF